jgi:hypothetical protein
MATRKQAVTSTPMFHYNHFVKGVLTTAEFPVIQLTTAMLDSLVKAEKAVSGAIIGSLLSGAELPFASGSEYVKAVNEAREKGAPIVTKDDVKSGYDFVQLAGKVRKITTEPLQSKWDDFSANEVKARDARTKENALRKANGENPLTAIRVTKPSVSGLHALVAPVAEVNHLESFIKSLKTAYGHGIELKGKKAMQDMEKLVAMIVSNGGELPKPKSE